MRWLSSIRLRERSSTRFDEGRILPVGIAEERETDGSVGVVDDGALEGHAIRAKRRHDVVDRLGDAEAEDRPPVLARLRSVLAGWMQADLRTVARVQPAPVIAGPVGHIQAERLGIEVHRPIHIRYVNRRRSASEHASLPVKRIQPAGTGWAPQDALIILEMTEAARPIAIETGSGHPGTGQTMERESSRSGLGRRQAAG